jgi:glucokinase
MAVGAAVAGWLTGDRERLIWGANLGARDEPVRAELSRRLGLPVWVDNDGNATARAEYRAGAAGGWKSLVLFTLGTGVGGGIVIGGQPLVGAFGVAGELGHMTVDEGGAVCVCGGRGCLELVASAPGIARAGRAATSAEVVAAARAGDAVAAAALEAAGRALGRAAAQLVPIVDPDMVLLGGSVAHAGSDYLLPAARAVLEDQRPLAAVLRPPPVGLGRLGPEAGALGAADLAREALLASPVDAPIK